MTQTMRRIYVNICQYGNLYTLINSFLCFICYTYTYIHAELLIYIYIIISVVMILIEEYI